MKKGKKCQGVLVFDKNDEVVATYPSVKNVAEEYHTDVDVIYHYLKSGKLWKKEQVSFDYIA